MTSRDRVHTALGHREPDRVPVDLGGSIMSGISVQALSDYIGYLHGRGKLSGPVRPVRAYELYQMLGEVELDLVDYPGIDILPV